MLEMFSEGFDGMFTVLDSSFNRHEFLSVP